MRERKARGDSGAAMTRLRREQSQPCGITSRGHRPRHPGQSAPIWQAFCALSEGRRWSEAGPDPIRPADVAAWARPPCAAPPCRDPLRPGCRLARMGQDAKGAARDPADNRARFDHDVRLDAEENVFARVLIGRAETLMVRSCGRPVCRYRGRADTPGSPSGCGLDRLGCRFRRDQEFSRCARCNR